MKLKRKTSEQKKAFQAYEFALRQEDRYLGSVFVTPKVSVKLKSVLAKHMRPASNWV
jgi:hypothetical protein